MKHTTSIIFKQNFSIQSDILQTAPPLLARYVPFAAVAAANCINIPLMRQSEILNGIKVYTENGEEIGFSKRAAYTSIVQVTASRITMAAPGMCKYRNFRYFIQYLHCKVSIRQDLQRLQNVQLFSEYTLYLQGTKDIRPYASQ